MCSFSWIRDESRSRSRHATAPPPSILLLLQITVHDANNTFLLFAKMAVFCSTNDFRTFETQRKETRGMPEPVLETTGKGKGLILR